MKQLNLFNAGGVPQRKVTRKRIEREAAKPSPWASSVDPVHRRPKLPTIKFFRAMAKRAQYVVAGLVEKPMPVAYYRQVFAAEAKLRPAPLQCHSVIHKLLPAAGTLPDADESPFRALSSE
jgi:hypothetical protein